MIKPPPIKAPIQDEQGNITEAWQDFNSDVFNGIRALQRSGTTADRPVKGLYVGLPYFDTTLTRPIWYTGTNWIRADGVVV